MNIKIDLNVNAPQVVAVIEKLIAMVSKMPLNVTGIEEAAVKGKEEKVAEINEESKDNPISQDVQVVTLEVVRAKLAELSQNGKQAQVKALIKKYGANKLTEIEAPKYSELLKDAEEL